MRAALLTVLAVLTVRPSHAQQQPPVQTIDFEDFSGPSVFDTADAPLKALSATFSGGELLTNATFLPADPTSSYGTSFFCSGCLPEITIDFSQKISNFSAFVMNGQVFNVTYTVEDDQGGMQVISLPANFQAGAGTVTLPDSGIRQVIISGDASDWDFFIDNVKFAPSGPVLIDPVDSQFLRGTQITTNTDILAALGTQVTGVSSDGVTQVVVRIPANQAGESLTVSVQDENGNAGDPATDGGVFALGGDFHNAAATLNVTAVDTQEGPMAFAIYRAPLNFSRGAQDANLATRKATLQVQSNDVQGFSTSVDVNIFRPPVVLVHGLWDNPNSWNSFTPLVNDSRFFIRRADYNVLVAGVTATSPSYLSAYVPLNNIHANALGFAFNARLVDAQIRQFIADFKHVNNIAAVQADVVGHSMGGDVTRTLPLRQDFLSDDTYGLGYIDRLITIGTPHLGSPLATDLLQDANACTRRLMAVNGNVSFSTVTAGGVTVDGAVGDLEGDGFGGNLSGALSAFRNAQLPFPMARVSATENQNNLNGLNCSGCNASRLRAICGTNPFARNPLALALTPQGWPGLFGQPSDSVVPLASQLNGGSGTPVDGVIHSAGMVRLNFNPPTELDSNSNIPARVIDLLNESPSGPDFQ
ncbi:MAG: esterase/lipase family protein [Actinomycetota bacterium]